MGPELVSISTMRDTPSAAAGSAQVCAAMLAPVQGVENNNTEIEGLSDLKLRLEAIDRLLSPSVRREMVQELVSVFQHEYREEISISEEEITVPKPPEEELAMA